MSVSKKPFGMTADGEIVSEYIITNEQGAYVSVLDYGATLRSAFMPDKNGKLIDVILGYDTIEEYEKNTGYFGATIGRNSNRIQEAEFEIGRKKYVLQPNEGKNQLHGGVKGFDKRMWMASCLDDGVSFYRVSPDGEEGFPGNAEISVLFRLNNANALEINYYAISDKDTVCNLTNHAYFNLNGGGDVLGHDLQIFSAEFTENNSECMPTGKILPVADTPMDFTIAKPIGRDIAADYEQIRLFGGYDHNYVLIGDFSMKCAAILGSVESGIEMSVYTDRPGMQLYTGNAISERTGKSGQRYAKNSGVCLETQFFPNALRYKHFSTPILRKGEFFRSVTIYEFGQKK